MTFTSKDKFDVTIREFQETDYDGLISLWAESKLPYKPKGRDRLDRIVTELTLGVGYLLVAVIDQKLVGSILATHDGRKGWINRLAVAPQWQRQGIARMLTNEAEKRLSDAGIGIFACLVEEPNPLSTKTFEALGYSRYEKVVYFTKRKYPEV